MRFSLTRHGALIGVLALALTACSTAAPETADSTGEQASVQFEDNNGTHPLSTPLTSVVATDNRTFETLASWGVELSAAAVALMPSTISYTEDDSIIDLGLHSEPDLESVVAVQPDVIINGQRFAQFHDDFAKLVPDAVIVELDPREGEPFDAELKRQTTVLGEIFGKQAEAEKLNADFDAAIERVNAAYSADDSVMAVITSGGEIGYSAPSVGRTLGPLFDIFDFTVALDVSESRGVTAVQNGNLVYMPADTYTNEGIQTYTEFFNALADAMEAKN